jgi:HSP20 family protein
MPAITKDKTKVNAYDNRLEVKSEDPQRKYHRTIERHIIETAKSAYNNGIFEICFKKKVQPKGKTIKIE